MELVESSDATSSLDMDTEQRLDAFTDCTGFVFSPQELELILNDPFAKGLYDRSLKVVENYQSQIEEKQKSLREASQHLEEVLLYSSQPVGDYEERFYSVKRERDDLALSCVKLQSELDSIRKTADHAVATLGKAEPEVNIEPEMKEVSEPTPAGITRSSDSFLSDISNLLESMSYKMKFDEKGTEIEAPLVLKFLENLCQQKEEQEKLIQSQLDVLSSDIRQMEHQVQKYNQAKAASAQRRRSLSPKRESALGKRKTLDRSPSEDETESKKKKILDSRFWTDLQSTYFQTRASDSNGLQVFSEHLSTFSRYSKLETLATLGYRPLENVTQLKQRVSKIEFDKDEDFFALAGDLGEIQLFAYNPMDILSGVITQKQNEFVPLQCISIPSMITDLSWSKHVRGQIASADVSGQVVVWDATSANRMVTFTEHYSEAWSLDFSSTQSGVLVSASQDQTVRLWDLNQAQSTGVIPVASAVCSVRLNPYADNELIFGSSNSETFYYDIRKLDQPLHKLVGHTAAVCGVAFHTRNQVVTQSTDGSIKLWDITSPGECIRTFRGHVHTKVFVGLSAKMEHIACGSEDNNVVIYNTMIPSPILKHSFATGVLEQDATKFVSAVCWNKHANVLLAANDAGIVKILKLS